MREHKLTDPLSHAHFCVSRVMNDEVHESNFAFASEKEIVHVRNDQLGAALAEREAFLHEIIDSTESGPEAAEAKFAVVQEKSGGEELFSEVLSDGNQVDADEQPKSLL